MGDGNETVADLEVRVRECEAQIGELNAAIEADPTDAELKSMRDDVAELLRSAQEALDDKRAREGEDEEGQWESARAGGVRSRWKVGMECVARYGADQRWYDAVIEQVNAATGMAWVMYKGYGNREEVSLHSLRDKGKKRTVEQEDRGREKKKQQREKFHEKKRIKDEELTLHKNKWKAFDQKRTKGKKKDSIFKTPDNPNARVGVGTCGIGGKPPTDYDTRKKHIHSGAD